jgi:inorganic pyrophosphatase
MPPAPEPPLPEEAKNEYGDLWAKRSAKPLPQIYGAIDRLGSGESGSLLDRYSDRFGHSLDRDIIVLRKKEREEAINQARSAPVVELLDEEEPDRLTVVENKLRELKPLYKEAKSLGDKDALRELVPQLEQLMAERRSLKGQTKTVQTSSQNDHSEETEEAAEAAEMDDADALFSQFFTIVNDLLGDELPEEAIEAFLASDGFELFKEVGADPTSIDDEQRGEFFKIIDEQLGNMPDTSITAFVESGDFAIYKQISEIYT